MVFAYRPQGDSSSEHELVVAFVVRKRCEVEVPWTEQLRIRPGHTQWGVAEALRLCWHAERMQELSCRPFRGNEVHTGTFANHPQRGVAVVNRIHDMSTPPQVAVMTPRQTRDGRPPWRLPSHGHIQGGASAHALVELAGALLGNRVRVADDTDAGQLEDLCLGFL